MSAPLALQTGLEAQSAAKAIAPERTKTLAWWRASPVKPGMPVRDVEGALLGHVCSVVFDAGGEIEQIHVESVIGLKRLRKCLPAERARITAGAVFALIHRRDFSALPDAPA